MQPEGFVLYPHLGTVLVVAIGGLEYGCLR